MNWLGTLSSWESLCLSISKSALFVRFHSHNEASPSCKGHASQAGFNQTSSGPVCRTR